MLCSAAVEPPMLVMPSDDLHSTRNARKSALYSLARASQGVEGINPYCYKDL